MKIFSCLLACLSLTQAKIIELIGGEELNLHEKYEFTVVNMYDSSFTAEFSKDVFEMAHKIFLRKE